MERDDLSHHKVKKEPMPEGVPPVKLKLEPKEEKARSMNSFVVCTASR